MRRRVLATPFSTCSPGIYGRLHNAPAPRRPSASACSRRRDSARCRTSRCGSSRIGLPARLRAIDMRPFAAIQPRSRAGQTPRAPGCGHSAAPHSREFRAASCHRPDRRRRDGSQPKLCRARKTRNSDSQDRLGLDKKHRRPPALQPPCSTGRSRGCRRTNETRWRCVLVSVSLSNHTIAGSLHVHRHNCALDIAVLNSDD